MNFKKGCSYICQNEKGKNKTNVMVCMQDETETDLKIAAQWKHWDKCTKCYGSDKNE